MLIPLLLATQLGSPAEIEWDAPAGCPSAADIEGRVQRLVGEDDVEPVEVRARVWRAETGKPWRLALTVGLQGTRELAAGDCAALGDAAVVMIGIGLNTAPKRSGETTAEDNGDSTSRVPSPPPVTRPVRGTEAGTAAPRPASATTELDRGPKPPNAAPGPATTKADTTRRRTWAPPRAILGVMTGAHGVGLPAPGAQVGGRLGIRRGPLRLAAVGAHWFRRSQAIADGLTAIYTLSTGGLELCGVQPFGRALASFEGLGCGSIEVGRLRALARGASNPRQPRHLWVAPGVGLGLLWTPRPAFGMGLRADVFVPTRRQRFVVGEQVAGTVGRADARATLVVEVRLPSISPPP